MADQTDFKPIPCRGTIQRIEFIDIDALSEYAVISVSISFAGSVEIFDTGHWVIPICIAQEQFSEILAAIQETDTAPPKKQ